MSSHTIIRSSSWKGASAPRVRLAGLNRDRVRIADRASPVADSQADRRACALVVAHATVNHTPWKESETLRLRAGPHRRGR